MVKQRRQPLPLIRLQGEIQLTQWIRRANDVSLYFVVICRAPRHLQRYRPHRSQREIWSTLGRIQSTSTTTPEQFNDDTQFKKQLSCPSLCAGRPPLSRARCTRSQHPPKWARRLLSAFFFFLGRMVLWAHKQVFPVNAAAITTSQIGGIIIIKFRQQQIEGVLRRKTWKTRKWCLTAKLAGWLASGCGVDKERNTPHYLN